MVSQNAAEYPPHHVTLVALGSLKWLHQTVKEMHSKENTFFDIDLDIKVALNIAPHPLYHVTYSPAKFYKVKEENLYYLTFDPDL